MLDTDRQSLSISLNIDVSIFETMIFSMRIIDITDKSH